MQVSNLYCAPNIIRVVKSEDEMAGVVTCKGEDRRMPKCWDIKTNLRGVMGWTGFFWYRTGTVFWLRRGTVF